MWNGKKKAVTFSFDDGVSQDERLIALLDKYHLKATFNLNSGKLGLGDECNIEGVRIIRKIVLPSAIRTLYQNHEIASHTLTHPNLTALEDETVIYQVNQDVRALEELTGKEVMGMAYPCGGVNHDKRVENLIRKNTKIRYIRTITSTHAFDLPENLMELNPTAHLSENCVLDLIDAFLSSNSDKPQLLYLWGHAYELDAKTFNWDVMEKICQKLSDRDDVYYGTNSEVLLGK